MREEAALLAVLQAQARCGGVRNYSLRSIFSSRGLFLRQWGDCEIESSDRKEISREASVKSAMAAGKVAARIRRMQLR